MSEVQPRGRLGRKTVFGRAARARDDGGEGCPWSTPDDLCSASGPNASDGGRSRVHLEKVSGPTPQSSLGTGGRLLSLAANKSELGLDSQDGRSRLEKVVDARSGVAPRAQPKATAAAAASEEIELSLAAVATALLSAIIAAERAASKANSFSLTCEGARVSMTTSEPQLYVFSGLPATCGRESRSAIGSNGSGLQAIPQSAERRLGRQQTLQSLLQGGLLRRLHTTCRSKKKTALPVALPQTLDTGL